MARTQRGQYRFKVKEDANGRPFLTIEPMEEGIAAFGGALLGLDLKGGTTLAYAEQVAQVLNDTVTGLTATFFDQALDA